jgi:Lhr-like helicase
MSNKHLKQMSSDELLQALQEDINDLVITQKIDEDIAESHMDVAEELHERVGKRWADNNESN